MKRYLKFAIPILDILLAPLTLVASIMMWAIRRYFVRFWESKAPLTKAILDKIGVFPIIKHYHDPFYTGNRLRNSLREDRHLPGINLNAEEQLALLRQFTYQQEILAIAELPNSRYHYSFQNGSFAQGDSEILYNMIRHFKPKRILEIGCGNSTLMIQHAITKNREDSQITCLHTCVEPNHFSHLAKLDVKFLKSNIENLDPAHFQTLEKDDILFIDSSHVIRPQGDVLFEFLEILPALKPGVIVHVHDIFTPKDYLDEWIKKGQVFWNEQYLLEAFLSFNHAFKIICANNYLKHHHFDALKMTCPMLDVAGEPGSFWMQRT